MPLVSTKYLIELAEKKEFALPAFNSPHLEFMIWILEEAENLHSPVIIQFAPVEYYFLDITALSDALHALSRKYSVPFSLHLDHSHEVKEVMDAILNRFSSVMIDGSRHPIEKNIEITKKVVEISHLAGVMVEGEIGRVGGLEGDELWEVDPESDDFFTLPEEAAFFSNKTGIDMLAVAVGTRHGLYNGMIPQLQFDRIREIKKMTHLPLVIHGGSGTPVDQLQQAVHAGVRKINFSTTLRVAFLKSIREYTDLHPDELFLPKIFRDISPSLKAAARECMESSLSVGKV
ncbi:MAG: class II fructose-bisphosphate aldolase [Candidatus Atribacteria bacterium]|nr:class II fructose-bisphosphate aldolase [Candidatus Atribacteria bacterium]